MSKLQIGCATKAAGVTIIPVEKIDIFSETSSKTCWWHGSKELYALVLCTSSGFQAYDSKAQLVNISDLISTMPKLAEMLETYR